jgi:hypothetical protein
LHLRQTGDHLNRAVIIIAVAILMAQVFHRAKRAAILGVMNFDSAVAIG